MNIEEVTAVDSAVRPKRKGKKHIDVGVRGGDHFIALFLAGTTAAAAVSLYMLHIDWLQLAERSSGIVEIFWKMAHMTTDSVDFTLLSFADTFSIMVLATVYSIFLGLVFGLLAAENVVGSRIAAGAVKAFFTFCGLCRRPYGFC